MNFLEALEKLKNGECEGIRFQNSIMFILRSDGRLVNECDKPLLLLASSYLSDDWSLVNPKPVYQEQEIKIYYNTKTGETKKIYPDAPKPKLSSDWVLMKGIQKVEIKQPVKKTYKFPLCQTTWTPSGLGNYEINGTAEIEPDKDKIVKNMTLTINWEEHEKEETSSEVCSSNLSTDKFVIRTIIDDVTKNGPCSAFFKGSRG